MPRCATNTTGNILKKEGDGMVKIKISYTNDSDLEYIRLKLAPKIIALKVKDGKNEKGFKKAYVKLR